MTEEKKLTHMDDVVVKVLNQHGSSLQQISRLKENLIDNADRSEIGTLMKVNEYAITAELARGSFGTVYLVEVSDPNDENSENPKCYAMKTFAKPKSKGLMRGPKRGKNPADEELVAIRNEISMMKRLSHPNIVKLLEVVEEKKPPNSIYMIMELVEGGDSMVLQKNVKMDPSYTPSFVSSRSGTVMGEAQASKIFRQLLSAMAYLHFNKIAHRDLKPENLLLSADGNLKLADFGVSEDFSLLMGDDERDGMVANTKGSWPFFAPEMIDADEENKYDAYKADVWAASTCLWVFIFGTLPFWQTHDPHDPGPIFEKILETKVALPPYPSRKSPELYELFELMFTNEAEFRPSFKDCEQAAWIRLHTDEFTEARLNRASSQVISTSGGMPTQPGEVNKISSGVKSKLLRFAEKSKKTVNIREDEMARKRNSSISDKKEVRKSLNQVYSDPPASASASEEGRRSRQTTLGSSSSTAVIDVSKDVSKEDGHDLADKEEDRAVSTTTSSPLKVKGAGHDDNDDGDMAEGIASIIIDVADLDAKNDAPKSCCIVS